MVRDYLFRTSIFRLALLASAVLCISLLLLSNFVLTTTMDMMIHQSELTVQGEMKEILNDSRNDMTQLIATVSRMSSTSPQFFYVLQTEDGKHLAGNLPVTTPILGVRDWAGPRLRPDEDNPSIHGLGIHTVNDSYLFVGMQSFRTVKIYATLIHYFLWILAFTFLALLFGGLFMSGRILSRVESISKISRDIISGDLKRRVPVSGANDEFDHLAHSLNAMLDRIQTLMEGMKQVSNDIAHDLRTPLSRLRQRLETARFKATTVAELHGSIDQSIEQIDSLLAIFSGLLRLAQIESGIRRGGFKYVELGAILRKIASLYKPVIDEKQQQITTLLSDSLFIKGDAELLTQLFVNLIDNATNHTPVGSIITVRAFVFNEELIVEVADNGPGIPEDSTGKVFQRFFRLEQSRSSRGHGLGLSLAKAIAEQHGGEISLRSNDPGLIVQLKFNLCPIRRSPDTRNEKN